MKRLLLALLLAACTTDNTEPCGPPPQQPDYAVASGPDGTSCLATTEWDALTAWMATVAAWQLCIINGGSDAGSGS